MRRRMHGEFLSVVTKLMGEGGQVWNGVWTMVVVIIK